MKDWWPEASDHDQHDARLAVNADHEARAVPQAFSDDQENDAALVFFAVSAAYQNIADRWDDSDQRDNQIADKRGNSSRAN